MERGTQESEEAEGARDEEEGEEEGEGEEEDEEGEHPHHQRWLARTEMVINYFSLFLRVL